MRGLLAKIEFKSGGYLSPVVAICLAANLVIFLACFFTQGMDGGGLTYWLLARRDLVLEGQVWRVLTAGFTHEQPLHALFNLIVLGFFGHVVEQRMRSGGFAALILTSVILGNLIHIAIFQDGVLGFSGASLAVLVAFATIAPKARVVFFVFFMPAWLLATIFVALDVLGALSPRGSGVAHLVHLVGAALGFAAIYWQQRYLTWWKRLRRRRSEAKIQRSAAREQRAQDEIDRLLEKVSEQGLPSLTPEERRFLDNYSKRR